MPNSHKKTPKDPLIEALERAKKENAGEETDKLKKELEEAKITLKETEERLAQMTEIGRRAIADMENLKRRTEEDRSRMALFANIELIQSILPSVQNAHRAIAHTPKDLPANLNEWVSGVTTIFSQIDQSLQRIGLTEIKALNETFDPRFHEALMQDKGPKDKVIEVLEPGYMLGSHLVRPAKVKVGMGE